MTETGTPELKLCPFCGGAPTIGRTCSGVVTWVSCTTCEAERDTIEDWNRRVTVEAPEERFEVLGYVRAAGLRSLREGNHTSVYPKPNEQLGYTILVSTLSPSHAAQDTAAVEPAVCEVSGETIVIDGRAYRKFIRYPEEVDDGTLRCIRCGQIDEDEIHDHDICVAALSRDASRAGGEA